MNFTHTHITTRGEGEGEGEREMEYQAIVIDDAEMEEKMTKAPQKSLPNGESSSQTQLPVQENNDEHYSIKTWSYSGSDDEVLETEQPHHDHEEAEEYGASFKDSSHSLVQDKSALEDSLRLIERRLQERREVQQGGAEGTSQSTSIFKFPHGLVGINNKAQEPEIVSIGPYHRGKDHLLKFEEHKWSFLDKLLSRPSFITRDLRFYLREMKALEISTRQCYADTIIMSSHDFVEMMLLDSCFIIELLRHLGCSEERIYDDDPILTRPWLIPILIRDILKLENQLPYFVIELVFTWSSNLEDAKVSNHLPILALKVLDLAFPRPSLTFSKGLYLQRTHLHLLDLFYSSLLPSNNTTDSREIGYRPSNQSIQSVTRLRPSGIKFKPSKGDNLFDIKFKNRVLEIPIITVNDFMSTLLINCVAWEQCQEDISRYFTDYVSFMNCLICQPRDVAFLCSDGIITRFSQDDLFVANLFNNIGKNVVFNIRSCYLSKQFREVEVYYSSNWGTMMRTYFSSPWSFLSVFSAIIIIALTMIQTIVSVLSYMGQSKAV